MKPNFLWWTLPRFKFVFLCVLKWSGLCSVHVLCNVYASRCRVCALVSNYHTGLTYFIIIKRSRPTQTKVKKRKSYKKKYWKTNEPNDAQRMNLLNGIVRIERVECSHGRDCRPRRCFHFLFMLLFRFKISIIFDAPKLYFFVSHCCCEALFRLLASANSMRFPFLWFCSFYLNYSLVCASYNIDCRRKRMTWYTNGE